jgi:hypothetical protein
MVQDSRKFIVLKLLESLSFFNPMNYRAVLTGIRSNHHVLYFAILKYFWSKLLMRSDTVSSESKY